MKLPLAKAAHYDAGPNMIPLVDVVMVLLIFLMLAGQFGQSERFLASNMPITATGQGGVTPPPGYVPDQPLEIRVDSPPDAPDRFIARAGQIRTSNVAELANKLAAMRIAFEESGTPQEKIQVVISPGRNVRYGLLIQVYEAANNAGFKKVGFAPGR